MKKNIFIFSIIAASLLVTINSFAGIGDGSGPFDQGNAKQEDNSSFGSSSFSGTFGENQMESVADLGEPPITPAEVPLDGGASLLLLGGIGVGISRSFKILKRNVFSRKQTE